LRRGGVEGRGGGGGKGGTQLTVQLAPTSAHPLRFVARRGKQEDLKRGKGKKRRKKKKDPGKGGRRSLLHPGRTGNWKKGKKKEKKKEKKNPLSINRFRP